MKHYQLFKKSIVVLMVIVFSLSLCIPMLATTEDFPPEISDILGNPTSWVKTATLSYTVTVTNKPLKSISVNGTPINISEADKIAGFYQASIICDSNKTITVSAVDNLNYTTDKSVNVAYIDTEAPKLNVTMLATNVGIMGSSLLLFNATDNAALSKITVNNKIVADITNGAKTYTYTYDTLFNSSYYSGIPYVYGNASYNNYLDIVVTDLVGNEYTTYAMIVNGELITPNVPSNNYPTYPNNPYLPDTSNPYYYYLLPTFSNGDKPVISSITAEEVVLGTPAVKNGISLKYQWQKLTNGTYINITGATETTYKTVPVQGDTYRVLALDYINYRQLTSSSVIVTEVPVVSEEPAAEPEKAPITSEDIIITGVPSDGKITQDGMMILVPSPMKGTWIWDEEYFSGSDTGVSVFKANKAGVTSVAFTAIDEDGNTATKYFIIEILSNDVKAPQTCDD